MMSKPSNTQAQEVVYRPDIEIISNPKNATAEEVGNNTVTNNDADMYHDDDEPSTSGSGRCGFKKNMGGLVLACGIGAFLMAAAVGIIGAANHSNSNSTEQISSNAALNFAKANKFDFKFSDLEGTYTCAKMSQFTSINENEKFGQFFLGGETDPCDDYLSLTIEARSPNLNYYMATLTTYALDVDYDGAPETPPLVKWVLDGLGGFGVEDKITFHSDWIYYSQFPNAAGYVDLDGFVFSQSSDSATMEVTKLKNGVIAIHFYDNQLLPDGINFNIPYDGQQIPLDGEHVTSIFTAILTKDED